MLDFTLSPAQAQLRAEARAFADTVLKDVGATIAPIHDPEQRFYAIKPFFEKMVEAGFLNALIPATNGGTEFPLLNFVLAAEELARVDINTPTAVLATGLALQPIIHYGTDEQKERFLRQFTDGEPRLGTFAFTEVTGGANFDTPDPKYGVQTVAHRDGNEWVIDGAKHYAVNGTGWSRDGADIMTVVCRTDENTPPDESLAVIVVEKGTPGVEITGVIETIGHRATTCPRIDFKGARVPADNILGQPGDGIGICQTAFSWTSSPIGAACVGRMRAAFDYAYEFARTDSRSGPHPVIEYQNVGYMLADLKIRIEAARYLAWKAGDHFDKTGGRDRELANITKIFNSEQCVQAVYDAMRLVGIDSYTDKTPIADILQDALVFPIYDAGNLGVRRRHMHEMLMQPGYDPLAAAENRAGQGGAW